jgi:phytoene synthase
MTLTGGYELLTPSSRPCVRAACELYGGILDRIEAGGHDVLGTGVTVPGHRLPHPYTW